MAEARTDAPATPAPPGGKTPAELRELADKLRGRVDLSGRLLGVLGTTAAAAVGINRLDGLDALSGLTVAGVVALAGIVLAVVGVLVVATRLTKVSRPLLLRADLVAMTREGEVDSAECDLIRPLYERARRDAGARSLVALDLRQATLRRLARRATDAEQRMRFAGMANDIQDDLNLVFGRALVIVVRRRAVRAVNGLWSCVAYGLVIGGLLAFSLGADKVTSTQPTAVAANSTATAQAARACADARSAGATPRELRPGCSTESPPPAPPSDDQRATTAVALLDALTKACESGGPSAATVATICGPLRSVIAQLLSR